MSGRMRWGLSALAVGIVAVVVGGQVGLTGEIFHRHGMPMVAAVLRIAWPLTGLAAMVLWVRTWDRGLGFFALGLLPLAVSPIGRGMPFWLYPLLPVGVALAAIAWVKPPGTPVSGLLRLMGITAGLVAAFQWVYAVALGQQRGSLQASVAVTAALGLWWGLLAVVAWRGEARHLRWLSGMAGCQALVAMLGVGMMLWPPMNATAFDLLYVFLSSAGTITAAGVVWTVGFRTTSA